MTELQRLQMAARFDMIRSRYYFPGSADRRYRGTWRELAGMAMIWSVG